MSPNANWMPTQSDTTSHCMVPANDIASNAFVNHRVLLCSHFYWIEIKAHWCRLHILAHTHTPISLHRKETFSFTHWPVASDSCLSPLNPPTDRLFHWNLNCSTILLNAKTVMFRNGYGHCVCLIAEPSRLISLRSMNNKIFVRMTRWGNQNVWNSLNTRHDFTLFPIELNMVEETKSESN